MGIINYLTYDCRCLEVKELITTSCFLIFLKGKNMTVKLASEKLKVHKWPLGTSKGIGSGLVPGTGPLAII